MILLNSHYDFGAITPRDYQLEGGEKLAGAVRAKRFGFDFSDPGVGKTITALVACKLLGFSPVVICTKSTIAHWQKTIQLMGFDRSYVTNWDKARRNGWRPDFADDKTLFIWDEFQKAGGRGCQANLMANWGRRFTSLFLSATPFDTPLRCRAWLHATRICDRTRFWDFIRDYDCYQETWLPNHPWAFGGSTDATDRLKDLIAGETFRVSWNQIDDFPDNLISMEPIPVSSVRKYNQLGKRLENLTRTPDNLAEIMEIRQELESFKIPPMVEHAKELLEMGVSPVLFVNFTATMHEAVGALGTDLWINGSVSQKRRAEIIEEFQTSKTARAIVLNSQAAAEGISLHDVSGVRRQSLICPNWSATLFRQVLGRIHRVGGKSPAVQRVMWAAGTYEDRILDVLSAKNERLDSILDSDLNANVVAKNFISK